MRDEDLLTQKSKMVTWKNKLEDILGDEKSKVTRAIADRIRKVFVDVDKYIDKLRTRKAQLRGRKEATEEIKDMLMQKGTACLRQ